MFKRKLKTKVRDIPFFDGQISYEDKQKYEMLLPSGGENYYRVMFAKGQGGSRTDETWNKQIHTCCGSKVYWRHKTACPLLKFDEEKTI